MLVWESEGRTFIRGADRMAKVADDWVQRKIIDERSALADARLAYCDPYIFAEPKLIEELARAISPESQPKDAEA